MKSPPDHHPPQWISKFLGWFLEPRILEACLGDLEEKFLLHQRHRAPLWKARAQYVIEGLGFLRMVKYQKSETAQSTINMISHTLLFFMRLVRRDKSYYLVSLLGLSIS